MTQEGFNDAEGEEMSDPVFQPGDVVRVKADRLAWFTSSFARRIADRDAVVERPWKGGYAPSYLVEFQKRNGRGKVFRERMRASELVLVRAATQEPA